MNKTPSKNKIIKHIQNSCSNKGVDFEYYFDAVSLINNDVTPQTNLEKAKLNRVKVILDDIKNSKLSDIKPLSFMSDCCSKEIDFSNMTYQCPACFAKVSCHGDFMPKGTLANAKISKIRTQLHKEFDTLWQDNKLTRKQSYIALAKKLNLKRSKAHFANVSSVEDAALYYSAIIQVRASVNNNVCYQH